MPVFKENPDATVYKIPLSRNKIIKKTIEGTIGWAFIIGIVFLFFLLPILGIFGAGSFISVLIAFILLLVVISALNYWYQTLYYKTYYYDIEADFITVRKGVWFKNEIQFAYDRIQDVYVDQDVLDRILGLYDVHLSTAGTTGYQMGYTNSSSANLAHFDGLDEQNASKIRDMILAKIKESRGKGQGL